MKLMYDNFIKLGLVDKAKAISDIPRYSHFIVEEVKETKSKKEK